MVEIVKNSEGDYEFRIKSTSGSDLLQSMPFKDEGDALKTLREAISNPIFERRTNHQGKFVISLKNPQGKHIGYSQTYTSEAGMENGIKNLKKSLSQTFT